MLIHGMAFALSPTEQMATARRENKNVPGRSCRMRNGFAHYGPL
jgi:hypothetical protein